MLNLIKYIIIQILLINDSLLMIKNLIIYQNKCKILILFMKIIFIIYYNNLNNQILIIMKEFNKLKIKYKI